MAIHVTLTLLNVTSTLVIDTSRSEKIMASLLREFERLIVLYRYAYSLYAQSFVKSSGNKAVLHHHTTSRPSAICFHSTPFHAIGVFGRLCFHRPYLSILYFAGGSRSLLAQTLPLNANAVAPCPMPQYGLFVYQQRSARYLHRTPCYLHS